MSALAINETHDPSLRSWIASANEPESDFPIQNLPVGAFRRAGTSEAFRGGVAIGSAILDLAALAEARLFGGDAADVLAVARAAPLNDFMALGHAASHALREALSRALREDSPAQSALAPLLVAQADAEMGLPAFVCDYTDFYSSRFHASAVGALFRPDAPLLPNYAWLPVGYHGRASSIVVSDTPVAWPSGQRTQNGEAAPAYGPSLRLDYEMELGIFIGPGNALGSPIPIADAEASAFGFCLLNDWSARDIQSWENQPLGPFLGKNFATTISPWVVTLEALAPFRVPQRRTPGDAPPLAYLASDAPSIFEIGIAAYLQSARMRSQWEAPVRLARSSYADACWTPAQLIAHHTASGCNLRPGDLLGTGTLSGPAPEEAGSLLELSAGGRREIALPNGESRRFLEDGDAVELAAQCVATGARRIGFGRARGIVARRPA